MVPDEIIVDLSYKNFFFFNKYLGLVLKGFENEVESPLRKMEARKGCRVVGSSFKRPSFASCFERELRKLECFVYYNFSSRKGRRSRKCGWDLVSECPG